jgi:hypothetical protein
MSLINDALKRAADAQKRNEPAPRARGRAPKGPEAVGPPMEPVVQRLGRRNDSMFSTEFGMIMLVGLLLLISSYFFYKWWEDRNRFRPHIPPGMSALEAMIIDSDDDGPEGSSTSGSGLLVIGVDNPNATNKLAATTNLAGASSNSVTPAIASPATAPVPPTPTTAATSQTNVATTTHPHAHQPITPEQSGTQLVATPTPKMLIGPEVIQGRAPTTTASAPATGAGTNHTGQPKLTRAGNGNTEKPKPETLVEFPEIELKGIIIMRTNSSAFVNMKTMRLGDMVKGAELTEIRQQWVKFTLNGADKKFYLLR